MGTAFRIAPHLTLCDRSIPVKKLSLDIEQLLVDSYETTTEKAGYRGTVHGNSLTYTNDFSCVGSTCGSPSNAVRCRPPA